VTRSDAIRLVASAVFAALAHARGLEGLGWNTAFRDPAFRNHRYRDHTFRDAIGGERTGASLVSRWARDETVVPETVRLAYLGHGRNGDRLRPKLVHIARSGRSISLSDLDGKEDETFSFEGGALDAMLDRNGFVWRSRQTGLDVQCARDSVCQESRAVTQESYRFAFPANSGVWATSRSHIVRLEPSGETTVRIEAPDPGLLEADSLAPGAVLYTARVQGGSANRGAFDRISLDLSGTSAAPPRAFLAPSTAFPATAAPPSTTSPALAALLTTKRAAESEAVSSEAKEFFGTNLFLWTPTGGSHWLGRYDQRVRPVGLSQDGRVFLYGEGLAWEVPLVRNTGTWQARAGSLWRTEAPPILVPSSERRNDEIAYCITDDDESGGKNPALQNQAGSSLPGTSSATTQPSLPTPALAPSSGPLMIPPRRRSSVGSSGPVLPPGTRTLRVAACQRQSAAVGTSQDIGRDNNVHTSSINYVFNLTMRGEFRLAAARDGAVFVATHELVRLAADRIEKVLLPCGAPGTQALLFEGDRLVIACTSGRLIGYEVRK
jgi:hypothetical protein